MVEGWKETEDRTSIELEERGPTGVKGKREARMDTFYIFCKGYKVEIIGPERRVFSWLAPGGAA